jgi:hypothetical protein
MGSVGPDMEGPHGTRHPESLLLRSFHDQKEVERK